MPDPRHDRRAFMKGLAYLGSQHLLPARFATGVSMDHSQGIKEILLGRNQMPRKQPRGRVKVGNGTVLADDGSLLRMVHSYVHDYFSPHYTDVNWWRAMRDVGHFNTVRVMAFLGCWPKSTQVMDLKKGCTC
jgi:hypothetical protein